MSDTPNYRGKTPPSCGFTEAEIEARAVSKSSQLWKIRCLNGGAHKHDDRDPSAYYYPEKGWYGCNVCGVQGYATDRLYANQQKRVDSRRSSRNGNKRRDFRPDRIPAHAKLTATHLYKRVKGNPIHRVCRYDWTETTDDGSERIRKEYLPQHLVNGQWKHGTGKIQWEPYNADLVASATTVYVVEGEKCADALNEATPADTGVITSAFGTNSAWKTDWTCLRNRVEKEGLDVVFIPDCDKPGEKYIHSIAWALGVESISVARVAELKRDDGYDVADWLSTGHSFAQLPVPQETRVISKEEFETRERQAKQTYQAHDQHPVSDINVETVDMLNDFNPQPLRWLVNGVVPKGKFTLLFGDSSIGKSTMALWLAARLSSNQSLFDTPHQQGKTLIYTNEDDWDDTTAVRLKLMQADLANIGHLRSFENLSQSFDWSNAVEVAALQRYVAIHQYDILIIDPIIELIGGNQSNNDTAGVRHAIERKLTPILRSGCAVLGVHHQRKHVKRNEPLLDRALGSQAWTAAARSVIYMQAVRKNAAKKRIEARSRNLNSNSKLFGVLVVAKSNIADIDGGWHYELPIETYEDHETPHPTIIVRASKITGITPLALANQYHPAEENPQAPTQLFAQMKIDERIEAKKEKKDAKTKALNAVRRLMEDGSSMKMDEIVDTVSEVSGLGANSVKEAVREVCESEGLARNTVWRLK